MHPATAAIRADETLRVLQLSDCHLSADPDTRYRGIDAAEAFGSLLPAMAAWKPHLVLATGDLSEDGSAASYEWLAQQLLSIGAPVHVLPGNHDDDAVMRNYFDSGPWNGPLSLHAGSWQLLLLDSSVSGRVDGAISAYDMRRLRRELGRKTGAPLLLALHHQPVPVGSPWIDRYMLHTPNFLLDLVARYKQVRAVVWGHVHQSFDKRLGNARLLACPSTAANALPGTQSFEYDPAGPACRWLHLHAQGNVDTGLLRAG